MAEGITTLTNSTFDEVIGGSDKTVIVDFWAEWCGPCKMISPILQEIAAEHDTVSIGKVNVDEQPDIAMRYQVMSIPTLIVFHEGAEARRIIGARPKGDLLAHLADFI
jgi:thioredoxin 1